MEKQRWEESKKSKKKQEDQSRERVRRKKMQVREKVEKWRFTVFFPMICGSRGSKSRLAKAEPSGQMGDEKLHAVVAQRCTKHISKSKCTKHLSVEALLEFEMSKKRTPLWREAQLEVKSVKNWRVRSIFGSWAVEKVHAVVARRTFEVKMHKTPQPQSTFGSWDAPLWHEAHFEVKNVQNNSASEHFWKFARRCGAKHMSKSKCTKHTIPRPLWKVQLWFRVAGARDSAPCQKRANREGFVMFCSISYTSTTLQLHFNYTSTTTTSATTSTTLQLQLKQLQQLQLQLLHQLQRQLRLQLQLALHYTTLDFNHNYNYGYSYRYSYSYSYNYHYTTTTTTITIASTLEFATPHCILQLWVRWPLQPLQKSQPPFGPSMDSLCQPCITTTHLSYSFLSLKLPPPPCAALLVYPILGYHGIP